MNFITIDGCAFKCDAPTSHYDDTGLIIAPPKGAGLRSEPVRKFVLHWTGGEGDAAQVHRVLQGRGRGLGIDFIIDRAGVIHQCNDPAVYYTYHAGWRMNPHSVGVEIVNYGFKWPVWVKWGFKRTPRRARDRDIYKTRFRGTRHFIADFYPAQKRAVLALTDALLRAFPDIEPQVPTDPVRGIKHYTLPRAEAVTFNGVLGHYHISKRKTDPGPQLIEEVYRHIRGT